MLLLSSCSTCCCRYGVRPPHILCSEVWFIPLMGGANIYQPKENPKRSHRLWTITTITCQMDHNWGTKNFNSPYTILHFLKSGFWNTRLERISQAPGRHFLCGPHVKIQKLKPRNTDSSTKQYFVYACSQLRIFDFILKRYFKEKVAKYSGYFIILETFAPLKSHN